jgi:hypothetical protein
MDLILALPDGTQRTINVERFIDVPHLKERVCRESFTPPALTRLYFGETLLKGDGLVSDFGVVAGSTIKVQAVGL